MNNAPNNQFPSNDNGTFKTETCTNIQEQNFRQYDPNTHSVPPNNHANHFKDSVERTNHFHTTKIESSPSDHQSKIQAGSWKAVGGQNISHYHNSSSESQFGGNQYNNQIKGTGNIIKEKKIDNTGPISAFNHSQSNEEDFSRFSIRDLDPEWNDESQQLSSESNIGEKMVEHNHPFQEEAVGFGENRNEFGGNYGFSGIKNDIQSRIQPSNQSFGTRQGFENNPKSMDYMKYGTENIRQQPSSEGYDVSENQDFREDMKRFNPRFSSTENPKNNYQHSSVAQNQYHNNEICMDEIHYNMNKTNKGWLSSTETSSSERLRESDKQFFDQKEGNTTNPVVSKMPGWEGISTSIPPLPIGAFPANDACLPKQEWGNVHSLSHQKFATSNSQSPVTSSFQNIPFNNLPPPPIPPSTSNLQQQRKYQMLKFPQTQQNMLNSNLSTEAQTSVGNFVHNPPKPSVPHQKNSASSNTSTYKPATPSSKNTSNGEKNKSDKVISSRPSTITPSANAPDYSALLQYIQNYQNQMSTTNEEPGVKSQKK